MRLGDDGNPMLDYDLSDYVWEGARRAYLSMAELQFAAGAKQVRAAHLDSTLLRELERSQRRASPSCR